MRASLLILLLPSYWAAFLSIASSAFSYEVDLPVQVAQDVKLLIASSNWVIKAGDTVFLSVKIKNESTNVVSVGQPTCSVQSYRIILTDSLGQAFDLAVGRKPKGPGFPGPGMNLAYPLSPGKDLDCTMGLVLPPKIKPGTCKIQIARACVVFALGPDGTTKADAQRQMRENAIARRRLTSNSISIELK